MTITEKINMILEAEEQARALVVAAEAAAGHSRAGAVEAVRLAEEEARKQAALRIEELWAESRDECDRDIVGINQRAAAEETALREAAEPKLPAAADVVFDRVAGGA